jgi:hypothetical protein
MGVLYQDRLADWPSVVTSESDSDLSDTVLHIRPAAAVCACVGLKFEAVCVDTLLLSQALLIPPNCLFLTCTLVSYDAVILW